MQYKDEPRRTGIEQAGNLELQLNGWILILIEKNVLNLILITHLFAMFVVHSLQKSFLSVQQFWN